MREITQTFTMPADTRSKERPSHWLFQETRGAQWSLASEADAGPAPHTHAWLVSGGPWELSKLSL